jgi:hypothetical protein
MESGQAISNILSAELEYYFGSVEKAKDALKTDKRLLNRWSKQKILNIIEVNGDNRRVTIWRKNPALVNVMTSASMSWLLCASFTRIIFEQRPCPI